MKIRITNEGDLCTKIVNAETGEELLVSRIEITQNAGEHPECRLVLAEEIQMEIETDAEFMCGKSAVEVVIWPDGKEILCCEDHARWAAKILRTLGSAYHSRPANPGEICTQKISEIGCSQT